MKKLIRWVLIGAGALLVACIGLALVLPDSDDGERPTATPRPTAAQGATRTPEPTNTPADTKTPWPTATVRATWTVTDTPAPTNTLTSRAGGMVLPTAAPGSGAEAKVVIDKECCCFDSPGNDNQTLTEECVCIRNRGAEAVNLQGWLIHDAGRNSEYTFRAFTLAAGASVRLCTGVGDNTDTEVYWNKKQAVWNNDGDTVYLYDANGTMVDLLGY